jgi:hypothetical protein
MDLLSLELKASYVSELLLNDFDSKLPSHREAKIQVAKLQRMMKAFDKKFPWSWQMIWYRPDSKLIKTQGEHKHRLNQQDKIVDRLFRKIIEEQVVRDLVVPGRPKITANKLRGNVKKYVENLNRQIHKQVRQRLIQGLTGLDKPGSKQLSK